MENAIASDLPSHSVSCFSPPLAYWQQPRSFRTSKYEPRKRRKKTRPDDEDNSDAASEGGYSGDDDDIDDTYSGRSSVLLTPNEAHQYRIAGHSMDRELPGGKFPHGVAPTDKVARINQSCIDTELSELNPPVYVPNPKRNHLHLRHLGVLTTILHRCLMEGDYLRAGRALGLLLRDSFGGHAIDVRAEGRWGIGAEILLWSDGKSQGANPDRKRRWFSRQGFEKAKAYYERLILQYPFRKTAPHALSPLHFYPAMFGLWIATVQEESQAAREAELDICSDDEEDLPLEGVRDEYSQDREERKRRRIILQARRKELAEAQQIATQMDMLLVSFPFSDSYELLKLRGMVSQWIADLHVSSVVADDDDSGFDDDGDLSMEDSDLNFETSEAQERKATELQKAQVFFDKATARASRASAAPG